MRAALTAVGLVAALAGAAAQDKALVAKGCILRAATMLPNIPGLTVVASTAAENATRVNKDTASEMRVEISINAAGISATYAFECLVFKNGEINAVRAGLSK